MVLNDRQRENQQKHQRRRPLPSAPSEDEMVTPEKQRGVNNGSSNQSWNDSSTQRVLATPSSSPIPVFPSPSQNNGLQHRNTPSKLTDSLAPCCNKKSLSVDSKSDKAALSCQEYDISIRSSCPSSPSLSSPSGKKKKVFFHSKKLMGMRRNLGIFMIILTLVSLWGGVSFTVLIMNQPNVTVTVTTANNEETRIPPEEPPLIRKPNYGSLKKNEKLSLAAQSTAKFYNPRVVFYEDNGAPFEPHYKQLGDDLMLHAPPGQEAVPQDGYHDTLSNNGDDDDEVGRCVPMSDWQTKSFPNCNDIHQFDLRSAGQHVGKQHHREAVSFDDLLKILGSGWFRDTWRLDDGGTGENVVLKTLRLEREFYGEYFELHRRDAVAMERLSHSPFVMDIYGYCGQSAINELADFGTKDITNLEKFNLQLRGKDHMPQVDVLKLQVAASLAIGVAHVHGVDGTDNPATMVHYDLNPRNIAIVKGGKPKLNDFNIAEFLTWNPNTNQTCGFPSRLHEPWWRAPEEVALPEKDEVVYVDEKVDVFALGNLLFHVLTTHSPRGKMKGAERIATVRKEVMEGVPPALHEYYAKSKNPIHVAFLKAMRLCYEVDPAKRAPASVIAEIMLSALKQAKIDHPSLFNKMEKK